MSRAKTSSEVALLSGQRIIRVEASANGAWIVMRDNGVREFEGFISVDSLKRIVATCERWASVPPGDPVAADWAALGYPGVSKLPPHPWEVDGGSDVKG